MCVKGLYVGFCFRVLGSWLGSWVLGFCLGFWVGFWVRVRFRVRLGLGLGLGLGFFVWVVGFSFRVFCLGCRIFV